MLTALLISAFFIKDSQPYVYYKDECPMFLKGDPLVVELYKTDDSLLMIFSKHITWPEALSICNTYEADLAFVNDSDKAVHVAKILAQSNIREEDFWIGGRKVHGEWRWLDGYPIFNIKRLANFIAFGFEDNEQCLAVERVMHDKDMGYMGIPCYLPKAFICERSASSAPHKPLSILPAQTVRLNKTIFKLYHGHLTWYEALAFCRTTNARLAVASNLNVINVLESGMLRSRPTIRTAWLGGFYFGSEWTWIPTGELIEDTDTGFPPWGENYYYAYSIACLTLGRSFVNSSFIATRCHSKKQFICEKQIHTASDYHHAKIDCQFGDEAITVFFKAKTWKQSLQFCQRNEATLAEPRNNETLHAIAGCLAQHESEPRHVWLGGQFRNSRWVWASSGKKIEDKLPWCDLNPKRTRCLNLDRTRQDSSIIYGLPCSRKQYFVCM